MIKKIFVLLFTLVFMLLIFSPSKISAAIRNSPYNEDTTTSFFYRFSYERVQSSRQISATVYMNSDENTGNLYTGDYYIDSATINLGSTTFYSYKIESSANTYYSSIPVLINYSTALGDNNTLKNSVIYLFKLYSLEGLVNDQDSFIVEQNAYQVGTNQRISYYGANVLNFGDNKNEIDGKSLASGVLSDDSGADSYTISEPGVYVIAMGYQEIQGLFTSFDHKVFYSPSIIVYDDTLPIIEVSNMSNSPIKNIDIAINSYDDITGINKAVNTFEYCLSIFASNCSQNWIEYQNSLPFNIGSELNGNYYLLVRRINNNSAYLSEGIYYQGTNVGSNFYDSINDIHFSSINQNFIFDNIPPSSSQIIINSNNTYSKGSYVNLNLYSIGATHVYLSESNIEPPINNQNWLVYETIKSYSWVNQDSGNKIIYAWFKDAAGNISSVVEDNIILDNSGPVSSAFTVNENQTKRIYEITIEDNQSLVDSTFCYYSLGFKDKKEYKNPCEIIEGKIVIEQDLGEPQMNYYIQVRDILNNSNIITNDDGSFTIQEIFNYVTYTKPILYTIIGLFAIILFSITYYSIILRKK